MLLLALLGPLILHARASPQVQLGDTAVMGRDIPLLEQEFFGGIPYAKAPIGEMRLRPPILQPSPHQASFDASNFGPACLQEVNQPTYNITASQQSEDCLSINIFRPAGTSPNATLPVMFWTHGGGFYAGSSLLFNGSSIVAQSVIRGSPIIYVNFNYRIGPLGFPQGKEAESARILNLGLHDQLTALAWIQLNIRAFGGDPTKVTAFGESSGAIMTALLYLNSPLDKLARATILESGSPSSLNTFDASHQEASWQGFVCGVSPCSNAATSGNNTLSCLRSATSDEIAQGLRGALAVQNPSQYPFEPTLDGPTGLIPDYPSKLLSSGHFVRIPFLAGTNLDEGTAFTPRNISSDDAIRVFMNQTFSPQVVSTPPLNDVESKLLQLYPDNPTLGSPFNTGNDTFGLPSEYKQFAAIYGDIVFQAPKRAFFQAANAANVKVYGYLFTEPQPATDPEGLGVYHSSELAFVYGVPPSSSPSSAQLSANMIDYWISFATTLDPNDGKGSQRPDWPPYTSDSKELMQLNGQNITLITDDFRSAGIDYINSVPLVLHH